MMVLMVIITISTIIIYTERRVPAGSGLLDKT